MREAAIVGVGCVGFKSITPEMSYKEIMFEAATRAYNDAGVDPRRDIDAFITCAEDYWEGFSIFDEFVPDQLGAVLRHLFTVTADGLFGLATAKMLIQTGEFDVIAVEAHSKASDMLTYPHIVAFALDPILNRPLNGHPYFLAGLDMKRYLHETGTNRNQCAHVVVKNRQNALENPYAAYGAKLDVNQVLNSEPCFEPLGKLDISALADGCIVLVVASEEAATKFTDKPIWIEGVGWSTETSSLETKEWGRAMYTELAAERAYKMAGIRNPGREIDFFEVDDMFSYKELQHLEALKVCRPGEAGVLTVEGYTEADGEIPVNVSGGLLGMGCGLEASGMQRILEVVLQLRGEAGKRQLPDVETGLAQSWRGIPTATGAVTILSNSC